MVQGKNSVRLARFGYEIYGFDISEESVEVARSLSRKYQLGEQTHFSVQTSEKLDFPDNFFDVVVGMDILHHVEIRNSLLECSRVLKSGGVAIFREPVESWPFDRLRNLSFVKRLIPNEASFDRHITQDERKLSPKDMAVVTGIFPLHKMHYFLMFARFDRFLRRSKRPSALEKLDFCLNRLIPGFPICVRRCCHGFKEGKPTGQAGKR